MKRVLLIAVLLLVACGYLGVVRVQAGDETGVIWGIVTYQPPWHNNMFNDFAEILREDYTPTPYRGWIRGAYPHQYWIPNDLPSARYRVAIYVWECDKYSISGRFYYSQGSIKQRDMLACSDSQMD